MGRAGIKLRYSITKRSGFLITPNGSGMSIPTDLFQQIEPHAGTQHAVILAYLREGNSMTGLDGLRICGSFKLASRISELRDQGHQIKGEMIALPNGKHVMRYWL
jgi:hypothetical protein